MASEVGRYYCNVDHPVSPDLLHPRIPSAPVPITRLTHSGELTSKSDPKWLGLEPLVSTHTTMSRPLPDAQASAISEPF